MSAASGRTATGDSLLGFMINPVHNVVHLVSALLGAAIALGPVPLGPVSLGPVPLGPVPLGPVRSAVGERTVRGT